MERINLELYVQKISFYYSYFGKDAFTFALNNEDSIKNDYDETIKKFEKICAKHMLKTVSLKYYKGFSFIPYKRISWFNFFDFVHQYRQRYMRETYKQQCCPEFDYSYYLEQKREDKNTKMDEYYILPKPYGSVQLLDLLAHFSQHERDLFNDVIGVFKNYIGQDRVLFDKIMEFKTLDRDPRFCDNKIINNLEDQVKRIVQINQDYEDDMDKVVNAVYYCYYMMLKKSELHTKKTYVHSGIMTDPLYNVINIRKREKEAFEDANFKNNVFRDPTAPKMFSKIPKKQSVLKPKILKLAKDLAVHRFENT